LEHWSEFNNLNDIISNDIFSSLTSTEFVPLTSEIIKLFTSEQYWPEKHLGAKQQKIGKWPDTNTNDSEPPTSKNEEITMKIGLNTILYGPPGTGKTYAVIDYSHAITNKVTLVTDSENRTSRKSDFDKKIEAKQIRFVTFHQSFSYEEFVEGIRANTLKGDIHYKVKPGIFKQICDAAKADTEQNYVLIIDEINRGNISKIFGELITLIEPSKRQGGADELIVILPYTQEPFFVPDNLYIIGTMNTADRSLALMDTALRRRFDFVEMPPKPELLEGLIVQNINIRKLLETMNQRIEVLYDREHTLGHAFFMSLSTVSSINELANIFQYKIIPLLQEYFFEDWEKIRVVLGDDQKTNKNLTFILKHETNTDLFHARILEQYNLNDTKTYSINNDALTKPESYNIYL
jgi:5-methylcytosine-specific restriction protein B